MLFDQAVTSARWLGAPPPHQGESMGLFVMFLVVAVMIGLAVVLYLVNVRRPIVPPPIPVDRAREVLDLRLVNGELSIEQYRDIRAALDGRSGSLSDR